MQLLEDCILKYEELRFIYPISKAITGLRHTTHITSVNKNELRYPESNQGPNYQWNL